MSTENAEAASGTNPNDLITDEEFDDLLDSLDAKKAAEAEAAASDTDPNLITEEEFERLLDEREARAQQPSEQNDASDAAADSDLVSHSLPSDMTIAALTAVHEQLRALLEHSEIHVDATAVAQIDTAGLQLLVAFQQHCLARDIRCDIQNIPPKVAEDAATLGLRELLSANTNNN